MPTSCQYHVRRRRTLRRHGVIASLALVIAQATHARASTRTWDSGGDRTSWSDRRNWSGDLVPLSNDDAVIAASFQNYPSVNLDNFNLAVRSLDVLGTELNTGSFSLSVRGAGIEVGAGQGSLGRIHAHDTDPAAPITDPGHFAAIVTDALRLKELGEILLQDSVVDVTDYYVQADVGSAIRGRGRFDLGRTDGNPGFLNHGLIRPTGGGAIIVQHEPAVPAANAVAELTGTLDLREGSFDLRVPLWRPQVRAKILLGPGQSLRIADDWTLEPNATFEALIDSEPGAANVATISSATLTVSGANARVNIGAGTTVLDAPLRMNGGTLELRNAAATLLITGPASFASASNVVVNGGTLSATTITNHATIQAAGLIAPQQLLNSGTLASKGQLVVDVTGPSVDLDGPFNIGRLKAVAGSIVIADPLTNDFAGRIELDRGNRVTMNSPWTLDATGSLAFGSDTNGGELHGAKATLRGRIVTGQTLLAHGVIACQTEFAPTAVVDMTAGGNLWLHADSTIRRGARFDGPGHLTLTAELGQQVTHRFDDGVVVNTSMDLYRATLELGAPVGRVEVREHFAAREEGQHQVAPTIAIDLAGTTPGSGHDQLDIADIVELDGTLRLRLLGDYRPSYGDAFDVITGANVIGQFDRIEGVEPAPGLALAVVNETDRLRVVAARPGDANLDGAVNLQDFNRLASHFGTGSAATWRDGDFTGDGAVNLQDFNRLASNFGLSAGPSGPTPVDWAVLGAAVPEPESTAWAALLGGLIRRHRRGRCTMT